MIAAAALTAVLAAAAPGIALVHDADERSPLTHVADATVDVPGARGSRPAAYVRRAGRWTQYWLFFRDNAQDRGVLRTGRHEGDWEMVQVSDREVVVSQHAVAERCPRRPGPLVVYAANGSHALYLAPGLRDRAWPDPNDEADGLGLRIEPELVAITARSPAWMRFDRPWGASRAGWFPGEQSSPRGPAFQPQGRWSDPEAWARAARSCGAERCNARGECDGIETAEQAGAAVLLLAAAAVGLRRRRRGRVSGGA